MEDLFAAAEAKGEAPFFVLADEVEDPHNLGALIRLAEAAGAHGIIIPKRRAVGLTWTVGKASAGAVEYLRGVDHSLLALKITGKKKNGMLFVFKSDCCVISVGSDHFYSARTVEFL
jgi:23S rRNA (guanosine2251-2'-O)-methyltransferase